MTDLLLALVIVLLIFVIILVLKKIPSKEKPPEKEAPVSLPPTVLSSDVARALTDLGELKSQIGSIVSRQENLLSSLSTLGINLKGIETKVVETTSASKDFLDKEIQSARRILEELKTRYEEQRRLGENLIQTVSRIQDAITGPSSRGEVGELILSEIFKSFPTGWIEKDFRVRGRVVEYAFILPNGKRVPIDSKWPFPKEDFLQLGSETNPEKKEEIVKKIEERVIARIGETSGYIDPACTTSFAITSLPDAVYSLCRKAHLEAFKEKSIILIPYSLTIPYLLTLYKFSIEFSRSVDTEKLESYLKQLEELGKTLNNNLENRIYRGYTMIVNAYNELKEVAGRMNTAIAVLRTIPQKGKPEFESGSPVSEQGSNLERE